MQNTEILEYIKQAFELKSQHCYKQAIEMLYKALEIETDNIEILFQLGELYFLLQNFSRASHYLEKVLSKNENHIEALRLLEKIYTCSNESKKACKTAEKIYNLTKHTDDLIEFINILSKTGDLSKIEQIEKISQPDDKICYGIAKAFYNNSKLSQAKEKLEQALKINPENEEALVLLGKIYFDEDEFEKSKNIFSTFSKTTENPEVLNYLGLFAIEDMNFTDAIKYFSKASNMDKENPKYFYNLGNAYFYNGWFEEASKAYLKAICMSPDEVGFRYSLAYLYFEQKKFEKDGSYMLPVVIAATELSPHNFIITKNGLRLFFAAGLLNNEKGIVSEGDINIDDLKDAKPLAKFWPQLKSKEKK